jgi:hypothetical protein
MAAKRSALPVARGEFDKQAKVEHKSEVMGGGMGLPGTALLEQTSVQEWEEEVDGARLDAYWGAGTAKRVDDAADSFHGALTRAITDTVDQVRSQARYAAYMRATRKAHLRHDGRLCLRQPLVDHDPEHVAPQREDAIRRMAAARVRLLLRYGSGPDIVRDPGVERRIRAHAASHSDSDSDQTAEFTADGGEAEWD